MDTSRLRSRSALALLTASLMTTLLLGILVVAVQRLYDRPADAAVQPLSDDQTRRQVVESAQDFVRFGKLRAVSGAYVLTSCSSDDKPPYQGSVYANFDVPSITETPDFFRGIARAMAGRGWHEGEPPGRHPGGHTLAKEGLTAVYYRDPDLPGRGLLKIHGECRDFTDHQFDTSGFVDITAELSR